ncbi:hypothetical protein [Amorphus sp. 3PC139-8]|uniref:hypothetical protein n=1 Tax=Amorphus sp. 3PC139-8 TaxID=2735676 RepID=UPI00345D776D
MSFSEEIPARRLRTPNLLVPAAIAADEESWGFATEEEDPFYMVFQTARSYPQSGLSSDGDDA